jgi:hypothetical protein
VIEGAPLPISFGNAGYIERYNGPGSNPARFMSMTTTVKVNAEASSRHSPRQH